MSNTDLLAEAVAIGDLQRVKKYLVPKIDINKIDTYSLAPLHVAVITEKEDVVKELLTKPEIDINKLSTTSFDGGFTALHWAVAKRNAGIVKLLLDDPKISPNTTSSNNFSAFHLACALGYPDMVRLLLELPEEKLPADTANTDSLDSALHYAAKSGSPEVAKILLDLPEERIGDVNRTNEHGESPLFTAIRIGDKEVIEVFLSSNRVQVDKKLPDGSSILAMAIKNGLLYLAKLLIEKKHMDINEKNNEGHTLVMIAAIHKRPKTLNYLLEIPDIPIMEVDAEGNTALHHGVKGGDLEVIKILLDDERISPNERNNKGETALFTAIQFPTAKNSEKINMLLEDPRLDPNHTDDDGNTALLHELTKPRYSTVIVQIFIENSRVDINKENRFRKEAPIHRLVYTSNTNFLKSVLSTKRLDINKIYHDDCTPLMRLLDGMDGTEPERIVPGFDIFFGAIVDHPEFEPDAVDKYGETVFFRFFRRVSFFARRGAFDNNPPRVKMINEILDKLFVIGVNPVLQNNAGETIEKLFDIHIPTKIRDKVDSIIKKYLKKK